MYHVLAYFATFFGGINSNKTLKIYLFIIYLFYFLIFLFFSLAISFSKEWNLGIVDPLCSVI